MLRALSYFAICVVIAVFAVGFAHARGNGQWPDDGISQWFRTLMQPDHPSVSCCGEADAYWADSYRVTTEGQYVAIITDERPDEPLRRPHIDVGTEIVIPQEKIKFNQGNPTGHGIVFIGYGQLYCYLPPGGV